MEREAPSVDTTARRRRAVALAALLAGVAIWLVTRRYQGIVGDARIYALMALARAAPGGLASDLFLRFGSQDAYSLFAPLYGALIRSFGLGPAGVALMLAGHALWLTGAWRLAHALARGLAGHAAFLLLTAVAAAYGGWDVLHAGEAMLTARPFAEGLTLLALAWAVQGAGWRTAAALVAAALFHPLTALAGIAVAFLMLALRRRVWFWAVPALAAAVIALAFARAPPFDALFVRMDGDWLAAARGQNGFVFTGTWMAADWARLCAQLATCAAAAVWSVGARRRLFVAACVTGLVGVAAAGLFGDGLHDALIVQLQCWRLAWITAVAALPAAAVVALRLRRRRLGWAASALLAAPLVFLTRPFSDFAWAWSAALAMSVTGLALAWLIRRGRAPTLPPVAGRMLAEAAVIVALGACGDSLINLAEDFAFHGRQHEFSLDPTGFVGVRLILLAAALALVWLVRRRPAPALVALAGCVGLAAFAWDARTPWQRYIVSGAQVTAADALPVGAPVLWGDEATPVWLLLRRPAYVSATQATGLLFSRATAATWRRRAAEVSPLVKLGDWSQKSRLVDCADLDGPLNLAALKSVCARAPGLAAVVLHAAPAGAPAVPFETPAAYDEACMAGRRLEIRWTRRFVIAPCASLRAPAGAADGGNRARSGRYEAR